VNSTAELLPPVLRDVRGLAWAAALDRSLELDAWQACPLEVAHAPTVVLWELAKQEGVAVPLWQAMTRSDAERTRGARERLVGAAPRLQHRRGTPWAVEEVMRLFGYADAKVLDRTGILHYDGEAFHDGEHIFGSGLAQWSDYIIWLAIDKDSRTFLDNDRDAAARLAAVWAPLRCTLVGWIVRQVLSSSVADPALEVGGVYRAVMVDSVGNRQAAPRTWVLFNGDGSCTVRWRLSPGELRLSEVAAVALTDRQNNDLHVQRPPAVAAADNVTHEGVWTFNRSNG